MRKSYKRTKAFKKKMSRKMKKINAKRQKRILENCPVNKKKKIKKFKKKKEKKLLYVFWVEDVLFDHIFKAEKSGKKIRIVAWRE